MDIAAPSNPVIVVPGITATYLQDQYPISYETVWSVLTKKFDRITLHPNNPDRERYHPEGRWYEAEGPSRVQSGQIYEVAYKELIAELRHNLTDREDRPVPVYAFGYDWRQPLDIIEAELARFIDEVIERTHLLPHYAASGFARAPKVNLVGHSMGGLLIAGCLQALGLKARVGKVATLAAPFRGSYEAVLKIAVGTAELGSGSANSRERESARLTPSLYHLLPIIGEESGFPGKVDRTFFDPRMWQPSVLNTLAQFIRLHGLPGGDPAKQAVILFEGMLETAALHRRRLERFRLKDAGLSQNQWLCIVGVDSKTRVRMPVEFGAQGEAEFKLAGEDRLNQWKNTDPADRVLTGDGTVPFLGAVPSFLGTDNLVCLTPDDFDYWEIQDKLVSAAAGFHGILPNMDVIHRIIVRHFTNRPDKHGNTWGWPAPGVIQWAPPLELRSGR